MRTLVPNSLGSNLSLRNLAPSNEIARSSSSMTRHHWNRIFLHHFKEAGPCAPCFYDFNVCFIELVIHVGFVVYFSHRCEARWRREGFWCAERSHWIGATSAHRIPWIQKSELDGTLQCKSLNRWDLNAATLLEPLFSSKFLRVLQNSAHRNPMDSEVWTWWHLNAAALLQPLFSLRILGFCADFGSTEGKHREHRGQQSATESTESKHREHRGQQSQSMTLSQWNLFKKHMETCFLLKSVKKNAFLWTGLPFKVVL